MSRTQRRSADEHQHRYRQETGDLDYLRNLNGRDHKDYQKPPGWWKRLRRRMRRAKEKRAFFIGKQIPQFKKNDIWDWN